MGGKCSQKIEMIFYDEQGNLYIYTRVQKSENLIQTINIIKTLENYIPIILSNWMIECS